MIRKLKIVIIIGYFEPSFGYQETIIAKHLQRLGHKVFVITSNLVYPWKNKDQILSHLKMHNRKYHLCIDKKYKYKIIRLKSNFELRAKIIAPGVIKTLKRINPDLVIAFGIGQIFPIPAVYLKKKMKYKLFSVFGDNTLQKRGYSKFEQLLSSLWDQLFKKNIYSYVFEKSDKILVNTPETDSLIKNKIKIKLKNQKKVMLLPLGFDAEIFSFNEKIRKKTRNKLSVKERELLIITAGKLNKTKKTEILLDSFSNIDYKKIRAKLFIVGATGDYLNYLKKRASSLGIKKFCFFFPFLPRQELANIYNAADIGVWPTQPSVTILEAMGTGLYVLLPKNKTLSHLLYEKSMGMYFNNRNNLNKKLNQINIRPLGQDYRKNRIERSALTLDRFSNQTIVKNLLQEYKQQKIDLRKY